MGYLLLKEEFLDIFYFPGQNNGGHFKGNGTNSGQRPLQPHYLPGDNNDLVADEICTGGWKCPDVFSKQGRYR